MKLFGRKGVELDDMSGPTMGIGHKQEGVGVILQLGLWFHMPQVEGPKW